MNAQNGICYFVSGFFIRPVQIRFHFVQSTLVILYQYSFTDDISFGVRQSTEDRSGSGGEEGCLDLLVRQRLEILRQSFVIILQRFVQFSVARY